MFSKSPIRSAQTKTKLLYFLNNWSKYSGSWIWDLRQEEREKNREDLGRLWGKEATVGSQVRSGSIQGLPLFWSTPASGKASRLVCLQWKLTHHLTGHPLPPSDTRPGWRFFRVTPVTSKQEQAWPSSIHQWCDPSSVSVTVTPTLSHLWFPSKPLLCPSSYPWAHTSFPVGHSELSKWSGLSSILREEIFLPLSDILCTKKNLASFFMSLWPTE